jgi:prepilin-type N-terminal cleavage/methylation domain-containing protein
MVRKLMASNKGFSLIELLIAVVIVGVLSTVGVPQYRKMVFKSKKSEAQIILGTIFTAESAFFNEYGAYGNNLRKMGASIDGSQWYVGGFNNAASATCTSFLTAGITPTTALVATVPSFYAADPLPGGLIGLGIDAAGQLTGTRQICQTSATYRVDNSVSPRIFTAFASANLISSDAAATCVSAGSPNCDIWQITHLNSITNTSDGTPN